MLLASVLVGAVAALVFSFFAWRSLENEKNGKPLSLLGDTSDSRPTVVDVETPSEWSRPSDLKLLDDDLLKGIHRRFVAVRTDRGPLNVHCLDSGPQRSDRIVILFHGNPTWSYLYRHVIRDLQDTLRCIAPDLVGFGLSDKPSDIPSHSIDFHIKSMTEVVVHAICKGKSDRYTDEEWLKQVTIVVVAQDWGGPIGSGVAAALEGKGVRIAGCVYGNTSLSTPRKGSRSTAFHRFSRRSGLSDIVFRAIGFPVRFGLVRAQGKSMKNFSDKELAAYRLPFRSGWRDRAGPLALARLVPTGETPSDDPTMKTLAEIEAWARGFKGDVSLVWGNEDPIFGRALRRMRELFAGRIKREVTTKAGHFLQEQVPTDLSTAVQNIALGDFLQLM